MKKMISILLITILTASVVGCSTTSNDECVTIQKTVAGFKGDVVVDVIFDSDQITAVKITGENETQGIGTNAIEQLPELIIANNGENVDVIAGATITSKAILTAVQQAINEHNGVEESISYVPGSYTQEVAGHQGPISVEVTFDESKILSVEIVSHSETYGIAYGMDTTPIEVILPLVIENQSLAIDTITGATVTSNALLSAIEGCVEQAGQDVSLLKTPIEKTILSEDVYDTDVVVIGAGVAGLSAGISAAENGADVLIIEKQSIVGGATTRSGGKVLAAGTEIQKEAGIEDTSDKMYDYLKSVGGDYIDDEKLLAFSDNALDIYHWMENLGVEMQDVEAIHQSIDTWRVHNTTGGGGMTSGFGGNIIVPLYNEYQRLDGDILYNISGQELSVNDENEVTGVVAIRNDGSQVTINANSVIIATGGYAANKELVQSYGEPYSFYATTVPTGNVGDGINMAKNIGAGIYENPAVQVVYLDFNSGVGINEEAGLILSENGIRVANEYTYQFHVGDALAKTNSDYGWYIATVSDPNPMVQYALTLDSTLKATSLEELAGLMGVDEKTFTSEIEKYNGYAQTGVDEDFKKPSEKMYEINSDTYYALKLMPSVTVTYSGITTNANAEVLDQNNQVINNLYASGEVAFVGLFGTEYPGCGMAISSSAYYGQVAGENAANH